MAEEWGNIRSAGSVDGPKTPIGDGYAVPSSFQMTADNRAGVRVYLEVAVKDGQAFATQIAVSKPSGVDSTALRAIPIRELIAYGIVRGAKLFQVRLTPDGADVVQVAKADDRAWAAVKAAVGYVRKKKGN